MLARQRQDPEMRLIDAGIGDGHGAAERAWIREYRRRGAVLVNGTDGVLILSELAGAYEQLQEHVLGVSPTDLEGTVRALHEALTMPSDERRRRSKALRQIIVDEDIIRWLEHQLSDLTALSRGAL